MPSESGIGAQALHSWYCYPPALQKQRTDRLQMMAVPVAQQSSRTISGVVKDATGETIIGANVSVKGTTTGTINDIDGKFSLNVPVGSTVKISYIGYKDFPEQ